MDATRDTDATLKAVLELDELKKDTAVTISIVNSAELQVTGYVVCIISGITECTSVLMC